MPCPNESDIPNIVAVVSRIGSRERDEDAAVRGWGGHIDHIPSRTRQLIVFGGIATVGDTTLAEVADNFINFSVVARREAAARQALATESGVVVPKVVAAAAELDDDIHDLAGLLRLGRQIWS